MCLGMRPKCVSTCEQSYVNLLHAVDYMFAYSLALTVVTLRAKQSV